MLDWIYFAILLPAAAAALFSFLAFLRSGRSGTGLSREEAADLLRTEFDRARQSSDEQARAVRQELGDNQRGFQETTLKVFGELAQSLGTQTRAFGERLDAGLQTIDGRAVAIAGKLDADLKQMGEEATRNRDALRQAIDTRLDEAASKQAAAAKDLREEVSGSVQRLSDALLKAAGEQRTLQTEQFETFAGRLGESLVTIEARSKEISDALQKNLADFGTAAEQRHEAMQRTLASRLGEMLEANAKSAEALRVELTASLQLLGTNMTAALHQIGAQQKERLDIVGQELRTLTEKHEKGQEALRLTVEGRLDTLRNENSAKLDEMRRTVDEKLQSTLEQRLGESFNRVVEQLERVHKGIGEMQTLATGVGDLKKVLSNVSVRGALGEIQLAMLLEQFLSPEQLIKNAVVQEGSAERVEFAVKLPGRETDHEVLLPIDAKFPQEDYERLVAASHLGDAEAVADAGKSLEARVKIFAKTIREKYIHPPRTTDFAILFLPTEGLYAEVLRRPGLFEFLQREYHVSLTGPTTLTAFLNALQMGFRSVAIEKRSSEVWQVLGAVRSEFGRYNEVVDRIAKQLNTAAKSVETLGTRTRTMNRKLRDVETLPDEAAQALLGFDANGPALADVEEEAASTA
ncbi:DNA recombination protein RmuC [Desertibaculum subflavum]|uniref:DNA recombination protein RmuC n=1 Tax=Desertibaculum subflavum TaxID=2268458 RepID=UPI0034D29C23